MKRRMFVTLLALRSLAACGQRTAEGDAGDRLPRPLSARMNAQIELELAAFREGLSAPITRPE